jgi:hypothetical protein
VEAKVTRKIADYSASRRLTKTLCGKKLDLTIGLSVMTDKFIL